MSLEFFLGYIELRVYIPFISLRLHNVILASESREKLDDIQISFPSTQTLYSLYLYSTANRYF